MKAFLPCLKGDNSSRIDFALLLHYSLSLKMGSNSNYSDNDIVASLLIKGFY